MSSSVHYMPMAHGGFVAGPNVEVEGTAPLRTKCAGAPMARLRPAPQRGLNDAERTRALVHKAAGRVVRADLVDARPWAVAAQVADRFRKGRAFLVGDCAHLMPPTGAFGGNTGIHDAQSLAWKLALVLRGAAPQAWLDSYDAERRPVVERTLAQALARLQKWFKDPPGRLPPAVEIVPDYDVVFGQRYDAGAFVLEEPRPDRPFEPVADLSGLPGTRMPHIALDDAGTSTLDLPGERPLLVTVDAGWVAAARALAESGASLDIASPEGEWQRRCGVERNGAVLVRPDRFVAWRTKGSRSAACTELSRALRAILGEAVHDEVAH